jgi:hypothetical protein
MKICPCCKVHLAAGKKINMMNMSGVRSLLLKGRIFKVLPDPFRAVWYVETRHPESQEAWIYRIPEGTSAPLQPLPVSFNWSKTLLSVGGGEIVIGQYESGGMPVISGVEAWDSNASPLWCYPSGKRVVLSKQGWQIFSREDSWTEVFNHSDIKQEMALLSPSLSPSIGNWLLPEMEEFLEYPCLPQGEILTIGEFRILSCFTQQSNAGLSQWLILIHQQKGLLFQEKIQKDLKGYSLDLWSVRNNKLFYISGYQQWNCLDLELYGEFSV